MEYNPNNADRPNATIVLSPAEEEHKRRASTAMVLGIIGVSIFFLPIINIAGFVLSIIALVKAKDNRKFAAENGVRENGMNTAGYVCGIVGIIMGGLGLLLTVLAILFLGLFTAAAVSYAPAIGEAIEEALPIMPTAASLLSAAVSAL